METNLKWVNVFFLAALMLFGLAYYRSAHADPASELKDKVDVDFTRMNAVMSSARMFELMSRPKMYEGKRIRVKGMFATLVDKKTGKRRFACIIADPSGCCVQGAVEFTLKEDPKNPPKWPADYPAPNETFSVQGRVELLGDKRPAPILRDAELAVPVH